MSDKVICGDAFKEEDVNRFLSSIQESKECWKWTGPKRDKGYSNFNANGRSYRPHRMIYELNYGPIPEGFHIDHLCRNRACVNPVHLEAVTNKENVLRGMGHTALNARKTHCLRGHSLLNLNVKVTPHSRQCRECIRIRQREKYWRDKMKFAVLIASLALKSEVEKMGAE